MDESNKRDSPGGSYTDSLIEKFRFEITQKSEDDMLNIKKLTIKASNKSRELSVSNRDIDKKISDLECLIMRLQEELNDLSCAYKQKNEYKQEDECEVDYCCPVVNECEEPAPCPEESAGCNDNNNEDETCDFEDPACNKTNDSMSDNENITPRRSSSKRYPIILRDVGLIQEQEDFDVDVKEPSFNETILINNDPSAEDYEEEDIPGTQNMFYDWTKSEMKDEIKEENKPNNTESITNMIAQLRAEIDETIHTLNEEP